MEPATSLDTFCCPVCKNPLRAAPGALAPEALTCTICGRSFPIFNGIPDFFLAEGESEIIDAANAIWQDESVVKARDTIYRLCSRELRGMSFCIQEIARRTNAATRILEVGSGTGHFTSCLAEVVAPGTQIYAFDCSWPILHTAQANLREMANVILLRANARGKLPFINASFDILLLRLAPLGPQGVPNVTVGNQLLKPGGWYFEAGWERRHPDSWTDWAIQHGFEHAEHHAWQYPRLVTEEEELARQVEQAAWPADMKTQSSNTIGNVRMTIENLLIAQKPLGT